MTGAIKSLKEKGFGFIASEGGDIFFHMNSLVGITFEELREGDVLSYEIEETMKDGVMKKNAINVQRA